jgi:hypothetical protein
MGVYMQITVKAKKNYGQVMFYPVCKLAEQFAEMVGQKTLTLKDLEKIKAMEVGIVVTYEEVNI